METVHRRPRRQRSREVEIATRKLAYRSSRREKIASYQRIYRAINQEMVAAYNAAYRKTHPERERARHAVGRAIATGKLIRVPCEDCGREPEKVNGRQIIQAHHHRGYEAPHRLNVVWLCPPCHGMAHRPVRAESARRST